MSTIGQLGSLYAKQLEHNLYPDLHPGPMKLADNLAGKLLGEHGIPDTAENRTALLRAAHLATPSQITTHLVKMLGTSPTMEAAIAATFEAAKKASTVEPNPAYEASTAGLAEAILMSSGMFNLRAAFSSSTRDPASILQEQRPQLWAELVARIEKDHGIGMSTYQLNSAAARAAKMLGIPV
jgi:hypothetical protein